MSKKKGVSAEEKRIRMLDLFYEKKEFFTMKVCFEYYTLSSSTCYSLLELPVYCHGILF